MTQLACSAGVRPKLGAPGVKPWLQTLEPSFREFPRQDEQLLDIAQVGGVPVQDATSERFVGYQNDFLAPVALTTADLDFGKLSESQYQSLKNEFGGLTSVGYDPAREYEAADFLPPVPQALLNQDLQIPEPVTLPDSADYSWPPGDDVPVDLTANCHGTSWEAMRAFQGHNETAHIYLGEAVNIDDALQSKDFTTVGEPGKSIPAGLQPGDVVAFREKSEWARMTMLLHTATYVGGGLFFEKPNTESKDEDSPYRLGTWSMVTGPVEQYVEGRWEAQAYRPAKELEPGCERFRSDLLDDWQQQHGALDKPVLTVIEPSLGGGVRAMYNTAMATVDLQQRADGRFELGAAR